MADWKDAYQLTTLAILPLLIPKNSRTALLCGDTLGLGKRLAQGACSDLAVLVEAGEKNLSVE